jgi:tripartite-type tricarboxylate transporter receptor subunit TctC
MYYNALIVMGGRDCACFYHSWQPGAGDCAGPAATPRATVVALRTIFGQVVRDADFKTRLEASGGCMMAVPAREQQAFLRSASERWGALMRHYGVTAE